MANSRSKTPEIESPIDPSTPSKSDAVSPPTASNLGLGFPHSASSASAVAPLRRSPRLASISPPKETAIESRKRKTRVRGSQSEVEEEILEENGSTSVGSDARVGNKVARVETGAEEKLTSEDGSRPGSGDEIRVLEEIGSMSLRSGARIEKRVAIPEIEVEEKLESADGSQSQTGEAFRVSEEIGLMSLRSGLRIAKRAAAVKIGVEEKLKSPRISRLEAGVELRVLEKKRMARMEREMEAEMNLVENLEFKGPLVEEKAIKENSMIVEEFIKDDDSEANQSMQPDERGKGKLVVDPIVNTSDVIVVEDDNLIDIDEIKYDVGEGSVNPRRRAKAKAMGTSDSRKEAERNRAKELAPKFAFFKAEEDGSEEEEEEHTDDLGQNVDKEEDWPGPFSTAMKIVRDREKMQIARELNSSSKKDKHIVNKIQWAPSNAQKTTPSGRSAPSLHDLCIKVLCENANEIESLNGVPDVLKHRIVWMLCRSRKMSSHIFSLLVSGVPTEIRLNDCSWATEGDFEGAFAGCNTEKLKVVQLDLSGRCLPDYLLQATLAKSANSLALLTTISLKGNYRLSDGGLNAIVVSAPLLSSINLSQCCLITSVGIMGLADKLGSVLRELYIDDCQDVDAMLVLPFLLKLKYLEVLSVAGIETVSNKFVKKLVSVRGSTIKELGLQNCRKLTAVSMKAIGEHCSQLCSLDLRNLNRLNDSAIAHLANGCRSIQKLMLRSNAVSDEAVAAFLEASGSSLLELCINNIRMVAEHTALAISRRCSSTLKSLDLSFCRMITDEALGLIVDSCSSLQMLKLFGCTQITDVFLEGHSNSTVKIIGSKGSVLDQIEVPNFL